MAAVGIAACDGIAPVIDDPRAQVASLKGRISDVTQQNDAALDQALRTEVERRESQWAKNDLSNLKEALAQVRQELDRIVARREQAEAERARVRQEVEAAHVSTLSFFHDLRRRLMRPVLPWIVCS